MKAVIYARYSSSSQSQQSIQGQLHDCYDYARRNNIEIVREYIDRAMSGLSDDRPQFLQMIQDSASRTFDRVLVWKLDRFARNRYDSAIHKNTLKKNGVRVVSVMENVGEGDESILMEAMLEALAEYYSADLKKKINRGIRETLAKGHYAGGSIPYGYKVQDHLLVVDEEKAPTIRWIFQQYASGVKMKAIVDELNRRGVRGRLGGTIHYNTFDRSLTNTAYIGKYVRSGQVIEGLCEPLIDEDTFYRVQQIVKKRSYAKAGDRSQVKYLLSGKVFCGLCGKNMTGARGTSKNGAQHYYYECVGRKREHNCTKKFENKQVLQDYVVQETIKYVLDEQHIDLIATTIVDQYNKLLGHDIVAQLQKTIAKIDHDIDTYVEMLATVPKSAQNRIYKKLQVLQAQRAAADEDMQKARITSSVQLNVADVRAWLFSYCIGDISDDTFKEDIIQTFVSSVYVYDDKVAIFYNLRGSNKKPDQPPPVEGTSSSTGDGCSSFITLSPPQVTEGEHQALFIFGKKLFGLICRKAKDTG